MNGFIILSAFLLPALLTAQEKNFAAKLTLKAVTTTSSYNEEGTVTQKTESEKQYTVDQVLTYYPGIKTPTKARLDYCTDNNATCNFITGNNAFIVSPSEVNMGMNMKSPVDYSYKFSGWERCDNTLKLTKKSEGGGSITDYQVSSSIGFLKYVPIKEEIEPVPLIKSKDDDFIPAPLVKSDYSYRLYVSIGGITPNINPKAPKSQDQFRDCTIDQWTPNTPDKYGISIPNFTELSNHKQGESNPTNRYYYRYTPITDAQVEGIIKTGKRMLNLKYYSYSKEVDANNKMLSEVETKIYVTLSIR